MVLMTMNKALQSRDEIVIMCQVKMPEEDWPVLWIVLMSRFKVWKNMDKRAKKNCFLQQKVAISTEIN